MKLRQTAIVFHGHVRCVNFILNDSIDSDKMFPGAVWS